MTHTPGPWKVDAGDDGDGIRVYQQRCRPELHGAQPLIAALDPGRGWIAVPVTELAHNARLISAAPDLLDVLMRLVYTYEPRDDYEKQSLELARAAIRKAKGG